MRELVFNFLPASTYATVVPVSNLGHVYSNITRCFSREAYTSREVWGRKGVKRKDKEL